MVAPSKRNESELTAADLRAALSYSPETGEFRWLSDRGPLASAGSVAGSSRSHKRGYRLIRVNYTRYLAHRLAWLYVHGEWPSGNIDHIDGNPDNNRIENLRIATPQQNCWNQSLRRDNTLGVRMVHPKRKGFQVAIFKGRKALFRKTFPTIEQAIAARDSVEKTLRGDFCPLRA